MRSTELLNIHSTLNEILERGLTALQLPQSPAVIEKLVCYVLLLEQWSQRYNLTAVRDPVEMIYKHILDSLAILPYVNGETIVDVGAGAGLPGIPLSICLPTKIFYLLDSNGKKCRFMTQAKMSLQLENVTVVHERVEKYQPDIPFDCILTRAFSSLSEMMRLTQLMVGIRARTLFLAMKGQYPKDELAELLDKRFIVDVIPLQIPGLDVQRHLVRITQEKYFKGDNLWQK